MKPIGLVFAAAAFGLACLAYGQSTEPRGSIPPGSSQDGARPAEGAIKGGSILPGETSGVPDTGRMAQRCEELTGTLREDCLKQNRDAATGGSVKPLEEPLTEPRTKSPVPAD